MIVSKERLTKYFIDQLALETVLSYAEAASLVTNIAIIGSVEEAKTIYDNNGYGALMYYVNPKVLVTIPITKLESISYKTNFLKRLFCKHDYRTVANIYGDAIINFGGARSIQQCRHCRKIRYGDGLDDTCKVNLNNVIE